MKCISEMFLQTGHFFKGVCNGGRGWGFAVAVYAKKLCRRGQNNLFIPHRVQKVAEVTLVLLVFPDEG